MRYCLTCTLASSAPICPLCTHATSTWPFPLTATDRAFLESIRVLVDYQPAIADAPPPS